MFDREQLDTTVLNKKTAWVLIEKYSAVLIGVKATASRLVHWTRTFVSSILDSVIANLPKVNNNNIGNAFIQIGAALFDNRLIALTRKFAVYVAIYALSLIWLQKVSRVVYSQLISAHRQVFWTRTSTLAVRTTGGWLTESGFSYRKKVTISNGGTLKTYFPVRFLIGESSGSPGCSFHLDGLCRTDFADLRFTTDDKSTVIDHWVESITGTTPNKVAAVWIEIASIAATPTLTNFYVYFGNSSAVSTSNGDNTFLFFDHFDLNGLDDTKWVGTYGDRSGYIITENSYVKMRAEQSVGYPPDEIPPLIATTILSKQSFSGDIAWYAKLYMGAGNEPRGGGLIHGVSSDYAYRTNYPWSGAHYDFFSTYNNGTGRTQTLTTGSFQNTTRYMRVFLLRDNICDSYLSTTAWGDDYHMQEAVVANLTDANMKSYLVTSPWNVENSIWCDYNFVTKHSATIPVFNSVGSTELGGTVISSYHIGITRLASSVVGLFMDMWGEGIWRVRHAAVAIGTKLYEPFRRFHLYRYLNPIIGAKVTATNFWRIIHSAVTVGWNSVTSYLWSKHRESIVKIGNKISSSRTAFTSKISHTYIGFKLIVKQFIFANSSVFIALSIPYAFGLKNFKVAVKAIGDVVTATRTIFLTRMSAVIIGVKVNGYNIHHYLESAAVAIGFVTHYALVFFVNVRKASIKIAVSLYMAGASWFQHKLIEEVISIADSIVSIFVRLTHTESITLTDYPPIEYKNLPKFWIEVRNNNGELLAVLENAFDVTIVETIDEFDAIRLSLPSGDTKAEYLTPSNWIWVHQQGVPLKIFKIYKQADKR